MPPTHFKQAVNQTLAKKKNQQKDPPPQALDTLVNLFGQRRYTEAETLARDMTERFPHCGFGWKALGAVFNVQGRTVESLEPLQKAVALLPDDADSYNNLGNTLRELDRLAEAETNYCRALKIEPDFAEAHNNLAITLKTMGRFAEAEASYRRALDYRPGFVDALNNLALLFNEQGKHLPALNTIIESLQIAKTPAAQNIFVECVRDIQFTSADIHIRPALVCALIEPWGRPTDMVKVCTDLVKLDPDIRGCVSRAADAWPLRLSPQELFESSGLKAVTSDSLLAALLHSAPLCDVGFERFLTMARQALLEVAVSAEPSVFEHGEVLSFYTALARQCFINEYVYAHTEDEIQKAYSLRDSLVTLLETNTQIPVLWLVAVATYFPLSSLRHSNRLLELQWPDDVRAVLVQQVIEPEQERQLRATIPQLTAIEDDVSRLVQNLYEENPYPRWVKIAPPSMVMNVTPYLRKRFPLAPVMPIDMPETPDILIAGCGTGQHSIETAHHFQNAHVLSIDLSMSSLGYAKRKTRELGVSSIDYGQADVLRLSQLGRSFDVIESVGVLHHLADPWTGWKVLLSLLRPGGFMRLGFYSEVARRDIVRIREFVATQGYGASPDEIRRCRQELIDLDKSLDFGFALKGSDFFSISGCRDLLFHVQEHRMTLTGIDSFIRNNGMVFLGFEISQNVVNRYKQFFPDDRAAINLAQWHAFEEENPDTFFGMYQFWVQKNT